MKQKHGGGRATKNRSMTTRHDLQGPPLDSRKDENTQEGCKPEVHQIRTIQTILAFFSCFRLCERGVNA